VIEQILPSGVVAVEAFNDDTDPRSFADGRQTRLFAEEEAVVARAVDKRRNEFTTGRACARAALFALGLAPVPIPSGPRGAPQWPAGVVGSITHCAGYRASAVAHQRDTVSIGIDAEPNAPVPDGVLDMISLPEERRWIAELSERSAESGHDNPGGDGETRPVSWDRLLFSAKESVYKAWFPLTELWLDFHQASITVAATSVATNGRTFISGTFTARLLVPGPVVAGQRLPGFTGRWLAQDGLLLTAIVVRPDAGPEHIG
jgi:4'-phosphopantetheinyl transferase EntD